MAECAGWTIWIDWLTELAGFDWLVLFYQLNGRAGLIEMLDLFKG